MGCARLTSQTIRDVCRPPSNHCEINMLKYCKTNLTVFSQNTHDVTPTLGEHHIYGESRRGEVKCSLPPNTRSGRKV